MEHGGLWWPRGEVRYNVSMAVLSASVSAVTDNQGVIWSVDFAAWLRGYVCIFQTDYR